MHHMGMHNLSAFLDTSIIFLKTSPAKNVKYDAFLAAKYPSDEVETC